MREGFAFFAFFGKNPGSSSAGNQSSDYSAQNYSFFCSQILHQNITNQPQSGSQNDYPANFPRIQNVVWTEGFVRKKRKNQKRQNYKPDEIIEFEGRDFTDDFLQFELCRKYDHYQYSNHQAEFDNPKESHRPQHKPY